ncbi:uncharacterized protein LOC105302016 [Pteropus vampyrus]|uniref:Uncharacterized protein LOC105302016 n=1 Tax=Pteropus vampyrus TaxID=132908 RepID=A0A6P6BLV6_PTEVA|nr:uncharacterized protein LOC105302016 [Pteropus vampyrus]
MRSGKACALETAWEDKQKHGAAECQAVRAAAAPQLLAEAPAVNGPGQEDAEEAEAPDSCTGDPGKSHSGRRPLQKRKRSPKSGLGQADLALVGLSADHVWLDKPLFDQAESSYRQRLADVAAQATRPPALGPRGPCTHGSQMACHHVTWGVWVNKSAFDQERGTGGRGVQVVPPRNCLFQVMIEQRCLLGFGWRGSLVLTVCLLHQTRLHASPSSFWKGPPACSGCPV